MSLDAILEEIRSVGRQQVEQIAIEAHRQAEQILEKAASEAVTIKKYAKEAAMLRAARERARIIRRARLEHLQIVGKVRENLVETALNQAKGRLSGIRSKKSYRHILRQFIQEALSELTVSLEDIQKASLQADLADQALVEEILQDLGLELEVTYQEQGSGGVTAKSDDGRLVVINTLESRLERATPYLRRYLAAYFEDKAHAGEIRSRELEALHE